MANFKTIDEFKTEIKAEEFYASESVRMQNKYQYETVCKQLENIINNGIKEGIKRDLAEIKISTKPQWGFGFCPDAAMTDLYEKYIAQAISSLRISGYRVIPDVDYFNIYLNHKRACSGI